MGLIKAITGAAGGVLGDQWKEYIYCSAMAEDVIVTKGQKKVSGRSSNKKGVENIITDGSIVVVNEGQCMLIVEQGKVVDICSEAGEYTYDASTEPSLFCGDLADSILEVFSNIGKRFTFGGETPKDQRVYYVNTKELVGNKYGTPSPVPFRVVDANIGLDIDIAIRCFGEYSYKVTNPILFYTNVCGNVDTAYTREELDSQLKTELLTALQPAFGKISAMGIRYSALVGHTTEIADALNDILSEKWKDLRGIEIVSFGISSVKASDEDEAMIKELQRTAVYRNPNMAAAQLVGAQADAMRSAAANPNAGPAMAFMGMNMAQNAGGANLQDLYAIGAQQQQASPQPTAQQAAGSLGNAWKCSCGADGNTGKFCGECGAPRPAEGWTCACGTVNKGKFCMECGAKKPAGAVQYKCDKCGWEPADKTKPPKFCPECGDPFDNDDIQ